MTLELTTISALRGMTSGWREARETIALVPTMGALHEGHLELVAAAKSQADRVVVSIFVNPTQFGPNEDFTRYPRRLEKDIALLKKAGADAVWLPSVEEMYPDGFSTTIHVAGVGEGLETDFRPGHFDGVATVVAKLLNQVTPDVALFGQKDYQQLCVIRRLVIDLNINTRIVGVPTVREADGLAMSSRNVYLTDAERKAAVQVNRILRHSAAVLKHEGRPLDETLEKAQQLLLDAGFKSVDYVTLCDSKTLAPLDAYQPGSRLLMAGWLGTTRLIDNIAVE